MSPSSRGRRSGAPGSELIKLSASIPRDVAGEWKRIIGEDCERIGPESWWSCPRYKCRGRIARRG
jgi:hypothetical protein